jgi:hypothetical protein
MEVLADEERKVMTVRRWAGDHQLLAAFNFSDLEVNASLPGGEWTLVLDSSDDRWAGAADADGGGATLERSGKKRRAIGGGLRAHSFAVWVREAGPE